MMTRGFLRGAFSMKQSARKTRGWKSQIPTSKPRGNSKVQALKSKMQRTPFELEDWSFFGAWRLGFGGLPPPSEYQKRFVIPAAANIFRASCRSQFLAAKLVKRSR